MWGGSAKCVVPDSSYDSIYVGFSPANEAETLIGVDAGESKLSVAPTRLDDDPRVSYLFGYVGGAAQVDRSPVNTCYVPCLNCMWYPDCDTATMSGFQSPVGSNINNVVKPRYPRVMSASSSTSDYGRCLPLSIWKLSHRQIICHPPPLPLSLDRMDLVFKTAEICILGLRDLLHRAKDMEEADSDSGNSEAWKK